MKDLGPQAFSLYNPTETNALDREDTVKPLLLDRLGTWSLSSVPVHVTYALN
jgi:hypothetical protein